MRARNLILAAASVLPLVVASPLRALPKVTFEAQALVVSDLAPGGEIAYLSVARESTGFAANVVRREGRLKDEDNDGRLRIELDRPVPWRSLWVVVELATGAVVPATPEGYPLRELEAPGDLVLAPAGAFTRLGARGDWFHVLVVRPATGAWVTTLVDGAASDEDGGGNRTIVAGLEGLEPLANGPPPPLELLAGDRVIEIDSDVMAWALAVVGGAP